MSYKYDAFFSYKRDPHSDEWHEKVKDKLQYWIGHELMRNDVRIFFDTEDITTGARWKNKLSDALLHSKCIITILSPLYFQSKWCVSEWKTFIERERADGNELIVPASFHDGKHFPVEAKERQIVDFSNYTSITPSFWETKTAAEFDMDMLKVFAKDVARTIDGAPPFKNFPLVEAEDSQVSRGMNIGRIADI